MTKAALFVLTGDTTYFYHVLLNCLDMADKGHSPEIVMDGASTRLLSDMSRRDHYLNHLWETVKSEGLVAGVCRSCSNRMGTLEDARVQGLDLLSDLNGHPDMAWFRENGYEIIPF